jgi:ribosomal protein L7/L12
MTTPDQQGIDLLPAPGDSAPSSTFRVVVESPGTCDASLIHSLTQVTGREGAEIARCFYQAPGVLVGGLDRATADRLAATLKDAGARTAVVDGDAAVEPGSDEWEIAVVVPRIDRIGAVFQEVVRLLQVSPQQALQILCQDPAVLMGRLSQNAANAIRDRFVALGADVALTRTRRALYDLYVDPRDEPARRQVKAILDRTPAGVVAAGEGDASGLVASGLSWGDLQPIQADLMRYASGMKILNRDFARFDLTLHDAGPDRAAAAHYLTGELGIPEHAVHRMLAALPIVVAGSIPAAAMEKRLQELSELGASVTAQLLSWQTFSVIIRSVGDRERAEKVLALLAGMSRADAQRALSARPPIELAGPFTPLHARWLRRDLEKVGASADVHVR